MLRLGNPFSVTRSDIAKVNRSYYRRFIRTVDVSIAIKEKRHGGIHPVLIGLPGFKTVAGLTGVRIGACALCTRQAEAKLDVRLACAGGAAFFGRALQVVAHAARRCQQRQ